MRHVRPRNLARAPRGFSSDSRNRFERSDVLGGQGPRHEGAGQVRFCCVRHPGSAFGRPDRGCRNTWLRFAKHRGCELGIGRSRSHAETGGLYSRTSISIDRLEQFGEKFFCGTCGTPVGLRDGFGIANLPLTAIWPLQFGATFRSPNSKHFWRVLDSK